MDAVARGVHVRDEALTLVEEFFGGVVPATPEGVSSWVSAHFVAQVTEASVEAFPALGDRREISDGSAVELVWSESLLFHRNRREYVAGCCFGGL